VKSQEGKPFLTYLIVAVSVVVVFFVAITLATVVLFDEYALRASYFTHGMCVRA
jgi:hypothetical protein